ncbi:MAG: hypothetical protein J4N64_07775, partial [Chloroflexi bacterium]|nr:hypothetical protein [Chloroflexota bacterium]
IASAAGEAMLDTSDRMGRGRRRKNLIRLTEALTALSSGDASGWSQSARPGAWSECEDQRRARRDRRSRD